MKDLIKKQQEETADTITDHFFRRGAVVSKKDYLYVLDLLQELQTELVKVVIEELESNPNEDGSISPNIQHWIESKQCQLLKLLTN